MCNGILKLHQPVDVTIVGFANHIEILVVAKCGTLAKISSDKAIAKVKA